MAVNWEMYDDEFDALEEKTGFQPLPNGLYNVTLKELVFDTWDDGSPRINFVMTVIDGPHAGRETRRSAGFNDYTKGELASLGFKGWKISAIARNAHMAQGATMVVKLADDKQGKQRVYINAVTSTPVTAPPPAVVTAPAPAPATQAALPGVPVTVTTPFD